jgi:hypothetical protein
MTDQRQPPVAFERWLPLAWLTLAFAIVAPAFAHPDRFASSYDWRLFETWLEVGRRTVLWYHQFPLWNPWTCGGQVYLANPQSLVAAPTFALILGFGTALGIKLTLVAYYFFACDGMYRLARSWQITPAGAALAAILFGTSGWFALHFAEGHCTFTGAALFPYMMYCYRRSLGAGGAARLEWEWALPLGALAAWVVALGGTSTPPMAMVILATMAVIEAVARRSLVPFVPLVLAALVAFAVGGVRVLPALEFALDHPRHLFETDSNNPLQMIRNGYWWKGIEPVPGKRYWFHEYGWRLPYLTPPLILWSLTVRRVRPIWIFVAVGAAIVAGSFWPYGPWWLLHRLPIFRDLRVPSRYQIFFVIGFALLCGAAFDDLRARLARWKLKRPRLLAGFTVAVLVACAADGLAFDYVRYEHAFEMRYALPREATPFYQVVGDWRSMMANVFENHGAIGCDEEAPLQRAKQLDEGPVAQARIEGPAQPTGGQLHAIRWSPNRVELDVTLDQPGIVSVNQNWNEHWRVKLSTGGEAPLVKLGPKHPHDLVGGRLAAEVPAGSYTVAFVYRPRSFVIGATLSLLSVPLAIGLWIWARRRRAT